MCNKPHTLMVEISSEDGDFGKPLTPISNISAFACKSLIFEPTVGIFPPDSRFYACDHSSSWLVKLYPSQHNLISWQFDFHELDYSAHSIQMVYISWYSGIILKTVLKDSCLLPGM